MEANKLHILAFMLLFCLCNRSDALCSGCSLKDIAVIDTPFPGEGNPEEHRVTVENYGICTQSDVKLACPGFNSSILVSPDLIRPDADGKLCTLIGGGPLESDMAIRFYYAWKTSFGFTPVSSTISCS